MSTDALEYLLASAATLGGLFGAGGFVAWRRARFQNTLDEASARKAEADAGGVIVATARELIEGVRSEMDRRVTDLTKEVSYLRGALDAAQAERDTLRALEHHLRQENADLRARIETLERRIAELTDALARATPEVVSVVPGGRRATDPTA